MMSVNLEITHSGITIIFNDKKQYVVLPVTEIDMDKTLLDFLYWVSDRIQSAILTVESLQEEGKMPKIGGG